MKLTIKDEHRKVTVEQESTFSGQLVSLIVTALIALGHAELSIYSGFINHEWSEHIEEKSAKKMETGIRTGFEEGSLQPYFTIGSQTFFLAEILEETEEATKEVAEWTLQMLVKAFDNV